MPIEISKDEDFIKKLKNSLKQRYANRTRSEYEIHVSDISSYSCIRKAYFTRKNPELNQVTDTDIENYIRGESSEAIITKLADIGIAQKELEFDGIIAHPDILSEDLKLIIELKDTNSQKKLNIIDEKFKGYLKQLLYYLVISGYENGILSIKYSSKSMSLVKSTSEGDYYYVPNKSNNPGIETWKVVLHQNDFLRDIIKNEMIRRKNLLLEALRNNRIEILPRLKEESRQAICKNCKFYEECMKAENDDAREAKEMALEKDVLDITSSVNIKHHNK
jgi:hypothetical protein